MKMKQFIKKKLIFFYNIILSAFHLSSEQLEMQYAGSEKISYQIPGGFSLLSTVENHHKANILALIKMCALGDWNQEALEWHLNKCVPGGCFMLMDTQTKQLVSLFMARDIPNDNRSCTGRIDWLATHPNYRGKRLGLVVTLAATNRLLELGYKNPYVTTDDHRRAAIKIFYTAGYRPVITNKKMRNRWNNIIKALVL